jgi:hypothetical protein
MEVAVEHVEKMVKERSGSGRIFLMEFHGSRERTIACHSQYNTHKITRYLSFRATPAAAPPP